MRYICIPEPGVVEIRETEAPTPKKGEALLRILRGGICGSDLGTFKGSFLYAKYPRVPGHEFSGRIVDIGPNDRGLKPGTLVTANPYFNCGSCYSCRRGHVNCCIGNETMGAQRDGAFQEYLAMPVERLYPAEGLSEKEAALIEPACISYHAVKRASVRPGERVLIVGAGTIGILAAVASRQAGALVHICDVSEQKLALARRFGVDGVILNSGAEAFAREVERVTGGDGFDVCIEAVGLASTFMDCIGAAAYRGRVVVIGIGKGSFDFRYSILQTKELDVFGSRNALKQDFLELIDLVGAHRVDLEGLVTDEYAFDEAGKAFADLRDRGAGKLKVMIRFP
jgi:Threonine dehydrogenase and related Zn-dependent dehydrogenases